MINNVRWSYNYLL